MTDFRLSRVRANPALLFLAGMLLCASFLYATPVPYVLIFERCSEQYLTQSEGVDRNEWAKKCFPEVNFASYSTDDPGMYALVYSPSSNSWQGPTDPRDDCGDWQLKAMCVFACYPSGEEILFENGYQSLDEAMISNPADIMVLDPESSLDSPQFKAMPVHAFSRSFKEDVEAIRTFTMASGGDISVTMNHPVLLWSGLMVNAEDVQLGDQLVALDGYPDPVEQIEDELYFGRVYNVAPKSRDLKENIIVAEGYLMGSAAYQYAEYFRSNMYKQLFEEP